MLKYKIGNLLRYFFFKFIIIKTTNDNCREIIRRKYNIKFIFHFIKCNIINFNQNKHIVHQNQEQIFLVYRLHINKKKDHMQKLEFERKIL